MISLGAMQVNKISGGGGGGPGAPVIGGASYEGGQELISGVAATPGWVVLAEFDLDVMPADAVLDMIGLVSQVALTLNVRLYDVTGTAVVAGSALATSLTTGDRKTSGDLVPVLVEGNRYQIQAECVGGALDSDWAIVRYVTLTRAP